MNVGIFVVGSEIFSTGTAVGTSVTEDGTSDASIIGNDDGLSVVGLNHGGIVTCVVGTKLGAIVGAIAGANEGFIVGRSKTENTVGETDGNDDGSLTGSGPGVTPMICPRAKNVDTVDDCCPTCSDHMNRH